MSIFWKNGARAILTEALTEAKYTPDRLLLEQSSHLLLFEYGEMKLGMPHHEILNAPVICDAYTEERFYMWIHRKGKNTYPIASRIPGTGASRSRIKGQLLLIRSGMFTELDSYRRNGVNFQRKRVKVILPFKDEEGKPTEIRAYAYIGTEVWKKTIQWDTEFYRQRAGGTFRAGSTSYNNNQPEFNRYYQFNRDDMQDVDPRCFLHASNGSFREDIVANEQGNPK